MITRYYLDGIEINEPNNFAELSIDIEYDNDGNKQSVSINNWEFGVNDNRNANDAIPLIMRHKIDGLTGGVGVLEGKPFKIELDNEIGAIYTIFDGYIDISKSKIYPDKIIAPAIEQGKVDWLNTVADKFDFEFLFDNGFFTSNRFIEVPYVINKKANAFEVITLQLSIYTMVQALIVQIKAIGLQVSRSANPFESATAIACLILEIVYTIVLLIAIIKLLIDLFNMLIHPVKYHNAMYVSDMIEIGLDYLGLKFSSSILQQYPFNQLVLLPEKYNIREDNTGLMKRVIGFLVPNKNESNGFFKGTFGELLRSMKELFHAKIIIDNDTLYFEKQDFNTSIPNYTLPNLIDSGYTFNESELKSNFILSFATDFNDRNTVKEYNGTAFQVVHSPVAVNNKKMVTIKDIERYTAPFSLGKKKTRLTDLEDLLDGFFNVFGGFIDTLIKVVNAIIDVVNDIIEAINKLIKKLDAIGIKIDIELKTIDRLKSPGFQNLLEGRIDLLKMETDFVSAPKLLMISRNSEPKNNKLTPENETHLNAKYIYENYHYFRNFVTTNGYNNQKLNRDFEAIPFTFTDYEKVYLNSGAKKYTGEECVLRSIKFKPNKQTATGSYSEKFIWTSNLQLTTSYPNE